MNHLNKKNLGGINIGVTFEMTKGIYERTDKTRKKLSELAKERVGKKNGNWKGGRKKHGLGYIYILKKDHPHANNCGYVFEHRLVMEKHLGRYLRPEEVIHHINEVVEDNRIENLMLFKNQDEHRKYHGKKSIWRKIINFILNIFKNN